MYYFYIYTTYNMLITGRPGGYPEVFVNKKNI